MFALDHSIVEIRKPTALHVEGIVATFTESFNLHHGKT